MMGGVYTLAVALIERSEINREMSQVWFEQAEVDHK